MMKKIALLSAAFVFFSAVAARADIVILRDGRSYSGTFAGAPGGKLAFKDNQGIQYSFPLAQIQSLVFSNLADHIALRGGDSYSGQLLGGATIHFRGANGIGYVFPLKDVASIVFTHDAAASSGNPTRVAPAPRNGTPGFHPATETSAIVISSGTPITVRTGEAIDSNVDQAGKVYSARIEQDVVDSTGNVAIPAGTPAQLHIANLGTDAAHPDLALALYSIDLNGRRYKVDTSSVTESGKAGYGLNKRTAEYAGGGAGLGALLGAVFGGGRGAGIGTLAGGAAGALTQYFTRGKQVKVPAESTLNFQLQRTLVLHP